MKRITDSKRCVPAMVACLVFLAFPKGSHARPKEAFRRVWNRLAASYRSMLRDEGIVGGSLMFIGDGGILAEEFYGLADIGENRPVDENTIYHWASITKTFTGIAVMQLRDRGLLSLDDSLIDYLPELKPVHHPFGELREITIRHAMSHSAGFRAPTWPWGGDKPWHPHEPGTWEQLVSMMPYTEILFEPGSRYSYSNPAIVFLGRIIEKLTGEDYEVYVEKNILRPLGMSMSYFDHTPYHLLKHRSNNYTVIDGKPEANGPDFDTGITVSNGGLNAPLTDMVRYVAFLLGVEGDEACETILKRSSLEEMWRPIHPTEAADADIPDFTESMALTFFIHNNTETRYIGHTGSQKSFRLFFYIHPETRTGVIAGFNTIGQAEEGEEPKPDTDALLRAIRGRVFNDIFPLFQE